MLVPRLPVLSGGMGPLDRLGWRAGTCFEAQGLRVGVRSNDPGLLERLPPALPPGWRPTDSAVVDQVFSLWVARGTGRPRVQLRAGNTPSLQTRTIDEALTLLESEIRKALAASAPDRIFVHAGVVGWRGRAIVVPGRSRSGKTTLVEALVKAGASYLSDEYAPLDPRGRVHPFAKPLTIRGPGGCDRHARRCSVEELGGDRGTRALHVGLVAFAEYSAGARWEPGLLTEGQAVLELLAHTVPARLRPQASLEALSFAASGALRLKGRRGEAKETAQLLLRAVEASS
jgi:hypothetical protein